MKKNLTLFSFCTLVLISNAVNASWEGNWLVGVSRDFAERKGHLNGGLNFTRFAFLPRNDFIQEHTDRGYVWDVLAGYQVQCNNWVVGGEVSGQWQDIDEPFVFNFNYIALPINYTVNARYKTQPIIGLTGRLGYAMTPYTLFYMRLGIDISRDLLRVNFTGNSFFTPLPLTIQERRWKAHFVGGFGVEVPIPITSHPAIRVEYNYHCYFTHHGISVNAQLTDGFLNPAFNAEIHPITQSGKVSLMWNFG